MVPLNARILNVLEMWAGHFPNRQPSTCYFPFEKYGAKGEKTALALPPAWSCTTQTRHGPLVIGKKHGKRRRNVPGAETFRQLGNKCADERSRTESREKSLKCRFHDLRHSAVTRLLEAGIPYPVVASMMGWSAATAIRMAKRYGHIGSKALRDAADVLGG